MCLDSGCVSKSTASVASGSASLRGSVGFRLWGPIGVSVGKSADKAYYDTLVCRRSTYWGIFEEGHSSGRVGENQRDVSHAGAEAKSDALCDGAWHAGVRFLIFPRTLSP